MNQDIDGITILNTGNYKILFGRYFYTNTRMGNNLVFEYKLPHTYMGQNCNNNENQPMQLQPMQLQPMQMHPMQPMQPHYPQQYLQQYPQQLIKCNNVKYIYIYILNNGSLQHEESMNPYPDIPNQIENKEDHLKHLKMTLYRQWKMVIITDETIKNNINMEYQKSKDEFMNKMKQLKEMRMRQMNPYMK
jgi:hypothetical protein